MKWLLGLTLSVILIITAYIFNMTNSDYLGRERFSNFTESTKGGTEAIGSGDETIANFDQSLQLPLADFIATSTDNKPSGLDANSCALADTARITELGGQYIQRTNNYRHDYPDNCSSLLTEFVGAFYSGSGSGSGSGSNQIGSTVPCPGSC